VGFKGPGATIHEGELIVKFPNGSHVSLFGADNPDSLRGQYFSGLCLDELADMKSDTWGSIIRPALSDRKGWAYLIGTPRGLDAFHDFYQAARDGFVIDGKRVKDPEWSAMMFRASDTNLIDPKELASARTTMSGAQFEQEFECSFAASSDNILIPLSLVSEACQRMVVLSEVQAAAKIIGVDVARFGDDRSVIVRRRGLACFEPKVFQGLDNMDLAARVAGEINAWSPDAVFIDSGRGEGCIDRLRQLGYSVIEVHFGGKPTDDAYANKRSEMWDATAKWLKAGGAIPNDQALKTDLCSPTYSFNAAGKMVLESKDQMKARGLRSSDVGDALALTFAMPVAPASTSLGRPDRLHDDGRNYDPFEGAFRRSEPPRNSLHLSDYDPIFGRRD
jgi:hypothetical protein